MLISGLLGCKGLCATLIMWLALLCSLCLRCRIWLSCPYGTYMFAWFLIILGSIDRRMKYTVPIMVVACQLNLTIGLFWALVLCAMAAFPRIFSV